jgi:hypothetical protein
MITGTVTTKVVPSTSLSTESAWEGPLQGTSNFTLISLEDAQIPNAKISRFHGNLVLSTPEGDLIGQDHGIWDLDSGAYVDLYIVSSGTGVFDGVTGQIWLSGTLDPATGQGLSQYRGVVSTPLR